MIILKHEYDAIKAHEYYLRTRELKGRQSKTEEPNSVTKTIGFKPSVQPKAAPKVAEKPTAEQRRATTKAQVEALRAKLEQVKQILAELVSQAKARAGVEPEPEPIAKAKTPSSTKPRELTAEQRAEAAKRAEEWREQNPDKAMDQEAAALTKKIQNVEKQIQAMREKLSTVIVNPFHTTGSVGAGSNTLMRKDGNSQNGS